MDQLIAATVVIGDRNYRIKIDPKDEEVVRRTVKLINDKIIEYKTHFAGKDMQDYIAMVVLWFATQAQANANSSENAELSKLLSKMDTQLEQVLAS